MTNIKMIIKLIKNIEMISKIKIIMINFKIVINILKVVIKNTMDLIKSLNTEKINIQIIIGIKKMKNIQIKKNKKNMKNIMIMKNINKINIDIVIILEIGIIHMIFTIQEKKIIIKNMIIKI
jgi:hypothetical protein